jgi:hypothetical protein
MSKNSGNPDLERPGGMHDAITASADRIAEQRRTSPTTTSTTTATAAGGPR